MVLFTSIPYISQRVDVMTLRTARLINSISKVFTAAAAAALIIFFIAYLKGSIEFKYISLPMMASLIGVTWWGTSKAAIMVFEKEGNEEGER